MRIVDLETKHQGLFSKCLEDWSPDVWEAGSRRALWVDRFLGKGLRAKVAQDDESALGGMIQYLPIERSSVDGEGLYFIPCVWVHGHPHAGGDYTGHGVGSALLESAEGDARQQGAKGMAAWGIFLPFWMRASWFKKHGYHAVDRQGLAVLLWKPFTGDARPPRWYPQGGRVPERIQGKVVVTSFVNGWCTAGNLVAARARRAASLFGDHAVFQEIDTSDRSMVAEWGYSDALFIDGKKMRFGPPPSFARIRRAIQKRVRRL